MTQQREQVIRARIKANREIANQAKQRGIGVGDLVKRLADALGIKQCPPCQRRQQIMNRIKIDGYKIRWDQL